MDTILGLTASIVIRTALVQAMLVCIFQLNTKIVPEIPSSASSFANCVNIRALVDQVGASLGLYSSYRGGRGGHPLTVPQYVNDHLKSIISLPPDWLGNDTTQMILDVLAHRQRVSSSPVRADEM